MRVLQSCSKACRTLLCLLALSSIALTPAALARSSAEDSSETGRYLFICAGDQARTAPDFLAVINFDQNSDNYGKSSPPDLSPLLTRPATNPITLVFPAMGESSCSQSATLLDYRRVSRRKS
jgi:hypothetical protein